jgi:hypothetical protein
MHMIIILEHTKWHRYYGNQMKNKKNSVKSHWFWKAGLDFDTFQNPSLLTFVGNLLKFHIKMFAESLTSTKATLLYGNKCTKENQWEILTFWKLHSNDQFFIVDFCHNWFCVKVEDIFGFPEYNIFKISWYLYEKYSLRK